jgi:VIT1/CCC1 family predicted Fe2+/Mn2+ transporter
MSFIQRYLDPSDILGEILFGLIMVLTFTLGASVAGGYERGLLLAAIGCNVAWGVIDGALVVMSSRYARRRRGNLIRLVQAARDERSALAAIRDDLESGIEATANVQDRAHREQVYRSVHALLAHARPLPMHIGRDDLMTGLIVFILVVLPALPAALPFFVIADPQQALRASNALLIGLLFVIGYRWGRHIEMHAWLVALVCTLLGALLVAIAIALGG